MKNMIQMMKPDSFMALILFTYAHFSVSIIDDCWLENDTFEQNLKNTPDLGCILGSNYMTMDFTPQKIFKILGTLRGFTEYVHCSLFSS